MNLELQTDHLHRLAAKVESPMEARFLAALAFEPALLMEIDTQFEIGTYRVDFAIPTKRIVVEIDGSEFHSAKLDRRYDVRRDALLAQLGWQTIRFAAADVKRDATRCVRQLVEIVAQRGGAVA